MTSMLNLAIDTGGTFTDLVADVDGELHLFKAPTTPDNPARGVLDVLAVAADGLGRTRAELLRDARLLVHGTTHAINALITGTTARTALLATAGHPDVLTFREGGRANPFDFSVPYPEPLVPRRLTFEIAERVAADGSVVTALDDAAARAVLDRVAAAGAEAIAVCLLWSIVSPAHEERLGELIEEHLPGVPYTLSHRLNPTIREYRRTSSTCIDASLKPRMSAYFGGLEQQLRAAGFEGRLLVVTSQGGMLDAADIAEAPVHAINSGPAMAPVAGRHYAAADTGRRTAIIADTGGTTFDVSLVRDGRIPRTSETWLGPVHHGHITGFPSVDVTSVGAGGGSIAAVDDGGLLRVGPGSAGSQPGPACYGQGGADPTVTDACLVLGHLDPDYFLGGRMQLDRGAAATALRRVAEPLGFDVQEAALAVVRIATENMVGAIEEITVNQGIDPREAVLVGGGGAAGLNLVTIARRLGCPEVLLPEMGAALSAAGALLSDLSSEFAITEVVRTDAYDQDRVDAVLARLAARCEDFARRSGAAVKPTIEYAFDGRYLRQNWDLEAPLPPDGGCAASVVAAAFHSMHERVFAISEPDAAVQVTTWRAHVRCRLTEVEGRRLARREDAQGERRRAVVFQDGVSHETRVVHIGNLVPEMELVGPAILESPFTTMVLDPGARARRTPGGSLLVHPVVEVGS